MSLKRTEIVISSRDFFKEVVSAACEQRRLKNFPLAQAYLVDLLQHFISADHLFDQTNKEGKRHQPLLADLYLNATNAETGLRLDLLKKLGDTSLYVSGFFGESLSRKVVAVDYYANMGELAYGSLSSHVREDLYRKVYEEFSLRFMDYVDVLTLASQKLMIQTDDNILRLYDHYLKTGSELAKDTLLQKGINVVPADKKTSQQ